MTLCTEGGGVMAVSSWRGILGTCAMTLSTETGLRGIDFGVAGRLKLRIAGLVAAASAKLREGEASRWETKTWVLVDLFACPWILQLGHIGPKQQFCEMGLPARS